MKWTIIDVVEFAKDWRKMPDLNARQRALMQYTEIVTYTDRTASKEDIDSLRLVGLNDEEILEATIVTCFYNWSNRMVDNLGVTIEKNDTEANRDMLNALVKHGIVKRPNNQYSKNELQP